MQQKPKQRQKLQNNNRSSPVAEAPKEEAKV